MFRKQDRRGMLVMLVLLGTTSASWAQQSGKSPSNSGVSVDEQQIRQGVRAFVDHYNAQKLDNLVALFAPDARMVFRDGSDVNGREAIGQSFAEAFSSSPQAAISIVVDSIRLLAPNVAVEEGSTSLFPDGQTLVARSRYTVLHLKKDGHWLMQSVRIVEEEKVSAYGELQPLEWLIGEWIDEGAEETVEAKFRWDESKNFLLEEFRVVRAGTVVLKGTQRIGFDPQTRQIRSWIFDDAGGIGEATWTAVDDKWVVKAKGVALDGAVSTATRTLTRAARDRVLWTATDRLSGGEGLPDIAFTMVRKSPQPQ